MTRSVNGANLGGKEGVKNEQSGTRGSEHHRDHGDDELENVVPRQPLISLGRRLQISLQRASVLGGLLGVVCIKYFELL